ncbi:unnamed protein product [Blepharisma stoltei]|uniref:Uncharacterized protein n=1 Tax=Blepharisma stoltei TaxID=1481888 RepID=A0AAU9IKL6_9CILI|nr:unnamed protein product [Blepharisma stoltei]
MAQKSASLIKTSQFKKSAQGPLSPTRVPSLISKEVKKPIKNTVTSRLNKSQVSSKGLQKLADEILKAKTASEPKSSSEKEAKTLDLIKKTITKEKEKINVDPQLRNIKEIYEKKTQKFMGSIEKELQQMGKKLKEAKDKNKRLKKALEEEPLLENKPPPPPQERTDYDIFSRISKEAKTEINGRFEELADDAMSIKKLIIRNYAKDIENSVQKWYNNLDLEPEGYQSLKAGLCKNIIDLQSKKRALDEENSVLLANKEKKIADLVFAIKVYEMKNQNKMV